MARKKRKTKTFSYPEEIKYNSTKHGLVTYTVTFTDLTDCVGLCDPNAREIKIQKGMSEQKTLETFVHELLHVIEFEDEIPNFTHWHIRKLDVGLTKLLLENFL